MVYFFKAQKTFSRHENLVALTAAIVQYIGRVQRASLLRPKFRTPPEQTCHLRFCLQCIFLIVFLHLMAGTLQSQTKYPIPIVIFDSNQLLLLHTSNQNGVASHW